jgi:peptidoglycan/LPS O-acetylase OafA/YrhL
LQGLAAQGRPAPTEYPVSILDHLHSIAPLTGIAFACFAASRILPGWRPARIIPRYPVARSYLTGAGGLRGLAALTVVISHAGTMAFDSFGAETTWATALRSLSGIGMPLFFVLSGFILYYRYGERILHDPVISSANFFVSRFARLYPLLFCILVVQFPVPAPGSSASSAENLMTMLSFLSMSQTWFFVFAGDRLLLWEYLDISWSVSTEFLFYVFFPFLCLYLVNRAKRPTPWPIIGLVVFAWIVGVVASANFEMLQSLATGFAGRNVSVDSSPLEQSPSDVFHWFFYFSPYMRVWEFTIGVFVARLALATNAKEFRDRGRLIEAAALAGLIALFYVFYLKRPLLTYIDSEFVIHNVGLAPALAALIFLVTVDRQSIVSRLLSRPFFVFFGEISYSLYLGHILVFSAVRSTVVGIDRSNETIALLTALALVLAATGFALVLRQIEEPLRTLVRDHFSFERGIDGRVRWIWHRDFWQSDSAGGIAAVALRGVVSLWIAVPIVSLAGYLATMAFIGIGR